MSRAAGGRVEAAQQLAQDRPVALLHLGQDLADLGIDDRLRGEVEVDALDALVAVDHPPDAVGEPADERRRRRRGLAEPAEDLVVIVSETRRATAATRPCLEPK